MEQGKGRSRFKRLGYGPQDHGVIALLGKVNRFPPTPISLRHAVGPSGSAVQCVRGKVKVKQSCYRPGRGGPGGFQEVKVPRFRDKGTGWW